MATCGCSSAPSASGPPAAGTACDVGFRRRPNPIGCGAALDCSAADAAEIAADCASPCNIEYTACADLAKFMTQLRGGDLEPITPEDRPDQFGPCGPIGPGNQPVRDCEYQGSIGVGMQGALDSARRLVHEIGLRAFRVFLVWQKRDLHQQFQEIKRIELMPVKVSSLKEVDLSLTQGGLQPVGGVTLSQISPEQVNEYDLRGYINGALPANDEEFFYEVRRIPRCAGEEILPRRFTIRTLPDFDAGAYGWTVGLIDQENPRAPDGTDQAFDPLGPVRKSKLEVLRG